MNPFRVDCSICLEPCVFLDIAQVDVAITHCGHTFCLECLEQWMMSENEMADNCPLCRTSLIMLYVDVVRDLNSFDIFFAGEWITE